MALGDLTQSLAADPSTGQVNLASPEAVKRSRALADALTKEGTQYSPIQSKWQGAARLAAALSGAINDYSANSQEKAGLAHQGALQSQLASALAGSASPSTPAPSASVTSADASGDSSGGDAAPSPDVSKFLPMFAQGGAQYGISPSYLARTAQIESGGNPNITNPSGAAGLMQFMPSTAKQYGLNNPFDPAASIDAGARLAADNKASLASAIGRDPTDAELYLAHQQGAGSAAKLLSNPNAPAASIVGRSAVVQNGGDPNMTAGQFASMWTNKFGNGAPTQVASADPAMAFAGSQAPAPSPASDAIDGAAPMPPVRPASLGGQGQSAIEADQPAAAPTPPPVQDDNAPNVPAPNAQVTAGQGVPGAPAANPNADRIRQLAAIAQDPWASEGQRTIATSLLSKLITNENKAPVSVAQGSNLVDPTTGRVIYANPKDAKDGVKTHVVGGALVDDTGKVIYKGEEGKPPDDKMIDFAANRLLAGDSSALQNLGRGAQSGQVVQSILKRAQQISEGQGKDSATAAQDILQKKADQQGRAAGARTGATLNARMDVYSAEANTAMDLALDTSRNLPRTSYLPLNQAEQAIQKGIGSPQLAQHVAQTNAVINTYAKAISPTGVPTQSDKDHAREILNAAQSPEVYEATIRQMQREISVAHRAARSVKDLGGAQVQEAPPNVPSNAPGAASVPVFGGAPKPANNAPAVGYISKGHKFMGGDPSNPASWQPVSGGIL